MHSEGNVVTKFCNSAVVGNVFTKFCFHTSPLKGMSARSSASAIPLWRGCQLEVPLPQLPSEGDVSSKFRLREMSSQNSASTTLLWRECLHEILLQQLSSHNSALKGMFSRNSASATQFPQLSFEGNVFTKFCFSNSALGGVSSWSSTILKSFSCSESYINCWPSSFWLDFREISSPRVGSNRKCS